MRRKHEGLRFVGARAAIGVVSVSANPSLSPAGLANSGAYTREQAAHVGLETHRQNLRFSIPTLTRSLLESQHIT